MVQVLGCVAHVTKKQNHDTFKNLEFSLSAHEISSARGHPWVPTRSRIGAVAAVAVVDRDVGEIIPNVKITHLQPSLASMQTAAQFKVGGH